MKSKRLTAEAKEALRGYIFKFLRNEEKEKALVKAYREWLYDLQKEINFPLAHIAIMHHYGFKTTVNQVTFFAMLGDIEGDVITIDVKSGMPSNRVYGCWNEKRSKEIYFHERDFLPVLHEDLPTTELHVPENKRSRFQISMELKTAWENWYKEVCFYRDSVEEQKERYLSLIRNSNTTAQLLKYWPKCKDFLENYVFNCAEVSLFTEEEEQAFAKENK